MKDQDVCNAQAQNHSVALESGEALSSQHFTLSTVSGACIERLALKWLPAQNGEKTFGASPRSLSGCGIRSPRGRFRNRTTEQSRSHDRSSAYKRPRPHLTHPAFKNPTDIPHCDPVFDFLQILFHFLQEQRERSLLPSVSRPWFFNKSVASGVSFVGKQPASFESFSDERNQ